MENFDLSSIQDLLSDLALALPGGLTAIVLGLAAFLGLVYLRNSHQAVRRTGKLTLLAAPAALLLFMHNVDQGNVDLGAKLVFPAIVAAAIMTFEGFFMLTVPGFYRPGQKLLQKPKDARDHNLGRRLTYASAIAVVIGAALLVGKSEIFSYLGIGSYLGGTLTALFASTGVLGALFYLAASLARLELTFGDNPESANERVIMKTDSKTLRDL